MGGSSADTPTTPEYLRASDAERDNAVNELRNEFVEGRLSHETFVNRMQAALGAQNRGQLEGLFTDLPPRRTRLLARILAALHLGRHPAPDEQTDGTPAPRHIPPGQVIREAQIAQGPREIPGAEGNQGRPADRPVQAPNLSRAPAPFTFPPGRGTRFTIGRTRDCDLFLSDLSVSRLHAELVRGEDGWLLNDLGSHNGTRLNGWLVRETVRVRAGDRLEFGSMAFVVQGDPQGERLPGSGLSSSGPSGWRAFPGGGPSG